MIMIILNWDSHRRELQFDNLLYEVSIHVSVSFTSGRLGVLVSDDMRASYSSLYGESQALKTHQLKHSVLSVEVNVPSGTISF